MTDWGQHLVDVHDHLRAELAQVHRVLEQVASGAAGVGEARSALQATTLRANAWALGAYCQAQCATLTGHHDLESGSVFPHLRRREPDLAPVLDRLHEEHGLIHDLLEGVDAALVELARAPHELGPVQRAVDQLGTTLLAHFAFEEEQLSGPLARHGMF